MEPQRPPLFSLWDLAALLGFGGLWFFYQSIQPSLPEFVPTHFAASGQPNGWTPKSALPFIVFGLPIVMWGIVTVTGVLMAFSRVDPDQARAAAMQPLRGLLGLGLSWLMVCMLLVPSQGTRIMTAGLVGFFAILALGIGFLARDYKKIKAGGPGKDAYKWGVFYYDPGDPRILVEKRLGIGWTLNFARPASVLIMAIVLLSALAAIAMSSGVFR